MTDSYEPVPVSVAREISERYGKQCVVIACYDAVFGQTHVTTFGQEPRHKEMAASAGDQVGKILSGTIAKMRFEDFRYVSEAQWAQEKDELLKVIRRQTDAIHLAIRRLGHLGPDNAHICSILHGAWDAAAKLIGPAQSAKPADEAGKGAIECT